MTPTTTRTPSDALTLEFETATGEEFPWGTIQKLHEIDNRYLIVEFERNRPGNAKPDWKPTINFHVYVAPPDGRLTFEDTRHSYSSLDHALVAAVVYRAEWEVNGINAAMNERLSGYIARLLDLGPEEE